MKFNITIILLISLTLIQTTYNWGNRWEYWVIIVGLATLTALISWTSDYTKHI